MADDRQFGYEEGGTDEQQSPPDEPASDSTAQRSTATQTESATDTSERAPSTESPSDREPTAERTATAKGAGTDLPLKQGGIFGAGAFLLSYLGTLMVVYGALSAGGVVADNTASAWQISGMALLSSLGVTVRAGEDPTSLLTASGLSANHVILLIAVPVITVGTAAALTAAGYGLVRYTDTDTLAGSVKTSLLLVPGWLVLTLVMAVLSSWESSAGTSYSVATGEAFLFAGLLFPALFGLVGGLLARWPEPVDEAMAKIDS